MASLTIAALTPLVIHSLSPLVVLAGGSLLITGFFLSLTVEFLFRSLSLSARFRGVVGFLLKLVLLLLFLVNLDFFWPRRQIIVHMLGTVEWTWDVEGFFLVARTGSLPVLLIGCPAVFLFLSIMAFAVWRTVLERPVRESRRSRLSKRLGRAWIRSGQQSSMALAGKEMIYALAWPGTWTGFLLSAGLSGVLMRQDRPSLNGFLFGVMLIAMSGYRAPFRSIDAEVVGRYGLLPLRGSMILGAKNLPYLLIGVALLLPPNLVVLARGEFRWSLVVVPAAVAVMLLNSLVGGCYSILFTSAAGSRNPQKGAGDTGGFTLACSLWLIPFVVIRLTGNADPLSQILAQVFLLVLSLTTYLILIPRIGRFLENQKECIMRKI